MRDHDELLRRYLLGRLETEEQNALEERLLREEDLLEMAEAAEADLLDDYAHDQLAPKEREQVAHRLADSPQGRFRLALIQDLGTIDSEEKAREKNGRVIHFPPARRKLSYFERVAAMAAMLAVAVLSSWLAIQTPEPVRPPQVAQAPAPPAATPRHQPVAPVAPQQQQPGDVIAESTPPKTPAPQPAAPLVIQLALSTLRGGDDMIPEKNVPPGTERVQLHLQLDAADKAGYASFEAVVRGAGPELRAAGLEPSEIDGKWTLVVELDPRLPEGMYEVEVSGVAASGSIEQIAYKSLEIQRNASAGAGTPD